MLEGLCLGVQGIDQWPYHLINILNSLFSAVLISSGGQMLRRKERESPNSYSSSGYFVGFGRNYSRNLNILHSLCMVNTQKEVLRNLSLDSLNSPQTETQTSGG